MKARTGHHLLVLIVLFAACRESAPIPDAVPAAPAPLKLPSEAPDDWLLAHIDVETTGLTPGYHEMIDIGLVYTTLDGAVLDSLFLRIQPQHPERLSTGAFAVNAFNPEKWQELRALSPFAAVDSMVSFHNRIAGEKAVLMVAFNSHFDAAFLDHLFRSAGRSWRELFYYFILDIPSMAWALGFRDLTGADVMTTYDVADEPHVANLHTGITGAMKNVRIYQALSKMRKASFRKDSSN